ncbi:uncharacterized protein CDAR_178921 [Caerostris darwini]|uniref:Monocarboxylate transporter 9 n=1 Tax=Caerostris darwini TaxID=1538125 RepID=A0AAV4PF23_9ARAC|nr:hypothetical protein CDAR_178781 [Caerostris darwini]GIX95169.1 uncharacterized protein CDAR_178921 [Caerostris darwini]
MEGPDQGWAWAVAFAACTINFIMAGLARMSGILYVAFIDIYGVDRKTASTPFSIRASTRNFLGPVVGILGQKYGVQGVIISGGILTTFSTTLCFFASDIKWITILFGGFSGIGAALTTAIIQVVIGQYFKKYRTTATGMGFSGGCVGSFLFPALIEWLLNNYGIEGTFLIMSGIIMHCIPAAMILKKPPWLKKTPAPISSDIEVEGNNYKTNKENAAENFPNIEFLRNNSKLIVKLLSLKNPGDKLANESLAQNNDLMVQEEMHILEALEVVYSSLLSSIKNNLCESSTSMKNSTVENVSNKEKIDICNHKTRSVYLKKDLASHAIENSSGNWTKRTSTSEISKTSNLELKQYILLKMKNLFQVNPNQLPGLFAEENSTDILMVVTELRKLYNRVNWSQDHEQNGNISEEKSVEAKTPSNSFWNHIKTMVGLFKNPLFVLICMSRTVHFLLFLPVVTTIVDFALDRGFREDEGSYVIASLSLGDLLGRLCLGWVTDKGFMDVPRFLLVGMILQGINTASIPLMPSKAAVYISLCIFGLLQGSLFVRHPVLVQKYILSNFQSLAVGCLNFFPGILGLALPIYIGYFRDTLGSYDYIFYINGVVGGLIGFMWVFEPYMLRCYPPAEEEEQQQKA